MNRKDVIIIGGGAAGLMTALQAARRGRSVAIIEHEKKIGNKIRISGGGRCNFTNLYTTPENYISQNPHFCKSALSRYTPYHFLEWIEQAGIAWHERDNGKLFFNKSAQQLNDLFTQALNDHQAEIHCGVRVKKIIQDKGFRVDTTHGDFRAESLVIATGGLSIPKIGATAFGYDVARQFGLAVSGLAPALVPFTLNPRMKALFGPLSGIALDVTARCNGQVFSDKMLFTHRGLSGPAILQISSYWNPGDRLAIDLAPGTNLAQCFQYANPDMQSGAFLTDFLPRRLAKTWSAEYFPSRKIRSLSPAGRDAFLRSVKEWSFIPGGTEGYRTAEVTRGGVDTHAISSKNMESRDVPGLYFVGEVLDVIGQLGGYNFQWAWASGWAAGMVV